MASARVGTSFLPDHLSIATMTSSGSRAVMAGLYREQIGTDNEEDCDGEALNRGGPYHLSIYEHYHSIYHLNERLHAALDRVYGLAVSLPEAPLDRFRARTASLPRTTEAERMVIQRIGQDIFRDALIDYWSGRCPITGITERALLRASHIKPWADCTDAERLDVHNGLLLSALWDAAFDRGLVSFADDGSVLASPRLGEKEREALGLARALSLQGLRDAHHANLAFHRGLHGF
jgi:hypothetical protein